MIALAMLLAVVPRVHGSRSASFTVTCTVVRRVTVGANVVTYVPAQPAAEPRVVGNTVTF